MLIAILLLKRMRYPDLAKRLKEFTGALITRRFGGFRLRIRSSFLDFGFLSKLRNQYFNSWINLYVRLLSVCLQSSEKRLGFLGYVYDWISLRSDIYSL
jgi:hypothetical protein